MKKRKLVLVYHAYLYGDNYSMMLAEQFAKLLSSGLYKAASKLYIGIAKHPDAKPANGDEWIKRWWSFPSSKQEDKGSPKVEIVVYPDNNEMINTLLWVEAYSKKNPDDYICFLHTKGITKYTRATESWRRYMEYFVIENWKDCVDELDNGFDAAGVMWNMETVYGWYPHFSGQFFWATCKYINRLDHSYLLKDWRYAGEFWIGTGKDSKIREFHNSRMNDIEAFNESRSHYSLEYPRELYAKEVKRLALQELNKEPKGFLTDKGVIHNYLPDYEILFRPYRDKHINIFEVGYQYGGSARLLEKYFENAMIRSIDINDPEITRPHEQSAIDLGIQTSIKRGDRTTFYQRDINGLTPEFFAAIPPDIAIDDGSHTLEDQITFVKLLYPNLQKGGILIIEDVPDWESRKPVFETMGIYFRVIDRRNESGVFDDVILIYEKL